MKQLIQKILSKYGYAVVNLKQKKGLYPDIKEQEFWDIYDICTPYTMTSIERMYSLYKAVDYILTNDIKGAFVECGVWRGGSMMLVASMLSNRKIFDRQLYLYDTFQGMAAPTGIDKSFKGEAATEVWKETSTGNEASNWCLADINDVKNNMSLTNYPGEKIFYVQGKVEDTITATSPDIEIALLRLDTDWYASTKHELNCLFPRLVEAGVLLIDDYGHWEGCRKAVDEYFNNKKSVLLNRIDYTGRVGIKILE